MVQDQSITITDPDQDPGGQLITDPPNPDPEHN